VRETTLLAWLQAGVAGARSSSPEDSRSSMRAQSMIAVDH